MKLIGDENTHTRREGGREGGTRKIYREERDKPLRTGERTASDAEIRTEAKSNESSTQYVVV